MLYELKLVNLIAYSSLEVVLVTSFAYLKYSRSELIGITSSLLFVHEEKEKTKNNRIIEGKFFIIL